MKEQGHRLITILALGLIAIVVTYGVVNRVYFPEIQRQAPSNLDDSGVAASWPVDFFDNRKLVGFSQNVFAGEALKETRRTSNPDLGLSSIQYDVEIIYNLKGSIDGEIVVSLDTTKGGSLTLGTTYLFTAVHNKDAGPWYFVSFHPAMKTIVSKDANLTHEELRELVLKHERTYELLNAYPNEILYEYDIQHGYIDNAFQSLSKARKQAVYAKFQELIPSRPVPEILPPPPPSLPKLLENTGGRCHDGIDNNEDGFIDQADPECTRFFREDLPALCRDNDDNDRDGLKDAADPDCAPFYPVSPIPPPQPPPPPPPAPSSTPLAPASSSTGQ